MGKGVVGNRYASKPELDSVQYVGGIAFYKFNDSLAVSECGKVIGRSRTLLKPRNNGSGYLMQSYKGTKKWWSNAYIHRMVATVFLPNPDNLHYVNHIDGDKTNNAASNLEWCTAEHNTRHAIEAGLVTNLPKGGQCGFQKTNQSTD